MNRKYSVQSKDKDFNLVDSIIVEEANNDYHAFILAKLSGKFKTDLYFNSQKINKE